MRLAVVAIVAVSSCRINFDPICELDGPCVEAVAINGGDSYARGPRLAVRVRANRAVEVRVAAVSGDCQAQFADTSWLPYAEDAGYDVVVEPSDGDKKVCAWARDESGATSVIARELAGINFDTIAYEAEHPPVVEEFAVIPVAGSLLVTWTISDREGLADQPVELAYTEEPIQLAAWLPLASGFGAGGTRHTGMTMLDMPTSAPFVVRLVPRDRAGNRGIPALSDVVNAAGWSVYMGSSDHGVGGAALGARLAATKNTSNHYAIDPATHDIYASDHERGIVRLDAATGTVERFIGAGTFNLPDDGPLPADASISTYATLRVGPDRKLYIGGGASFAADDTSTSGVIYQIDLETRHCRRYVGGGTANDATATPPTAFAFPWVFDLDEDATLYFLTSCSPGTSNPVARLMKVTQAPDGTAGTVGVVAGNCVDATVPPGGPYDPLATPLGAFPYKAIGTIAPWDHGRVVYYSSYSPAGGGPGVVWKIVDGQLYSSDISVRSSGSIAYDRANDLLYAGNTSLDAYKPNLAGAGDTLVGTVVAADGGGDCIRDGIDPLSACVHVQFSIQPTAERVYFFDGPGLNDEGSYRIRFVDAAGTLRTYLGGLPFHGEGLDRRVVRGRFAGINYKPASAPNQSAFASGLYFLDPHALVLGYVDPSTDLVSIEWGNQSKLEIEHETGIAIGRDVSLGVGYASGNLHPLQFDDSGLPWLRYGPRPNYGHLIRVDGARRTVKLQSGASEWEGAADGADPSKLDLWPFGAVSNLTLSGQRAFLLGGSSGSDPTYTLRMLDFSAGAVTRLMGAAGNTYTADRLTPGTVTSASISAVCGNNNRNCYTAYRADQDRLYFSELSRLRYITQPANPASSTLVTLFTEPSGERIHSFAFRPDGSQVLYIHESRQLRCHDISSGAPWCNDTDLGPPAVLGVVESGPNQLTWKDDNTLLISTYTGQVLELRLP